MTALKKPKISRHARADALARTVQKLQQKRADDWANTVTGFGTDGGNSPMANTAFYASRTLSQQDLELMYRDDWVAAKIIDNPAEDMTRLGVDFLYDDDEKPDLIESVEERLDELNWMPQLFDLIKQSRLYGGGLMIFFFEDPDELSDPLNEKAVRDLLRIENVHRYLAYPVSWYPSSHPEKPRAPEHYQVQLIGINSVESVYVHESRCIRMDGRALPINMRLRNMGWGDTYLQKVYVALKHFQTASKAGAETLEDFVFKTLKIENLQDLIMNSDDETIINRIILAASKMTVHNVAVYGEGEEITKQGTPMTGFADLWDRYSEIISAAAEIPRSRFFSGQSGALGGNVVDSDLRNYYDRIALKQTRLLKPAMTRFIKFVSFADSFDPDNIKFNFKPLWMPTEAEQTETRKLQADIDNIYIQGQVVTPEEVAESRFAKKEIDLTTMNIDFEEREKQEQAQQEVDQEQLEKLAALQQQPTPDGIGNDPGEGKGDGTGLKSIEKE